jgi:hypothetical protein
VHLHKCGGTLILRYFHHSSRLTFINTMRSLFTLRNLPLAVFSLTVGVSATSAGLPVVDLGYTKHQALSYNVSSTYSDQTGT